MRGRKKGKKRGRADECRARLEAGARSKLGKGSKVLEVGQVKSGDGSGEGSGCGNGKRKSA